MPRHDGWIASDDAKRLYWQAWLPEGEPRAIVVLAHGVNEHSGRYRHVGERLARDGIAVHAIDHRGHGRSDGHPALIDRLDQVVDDLKVFIDIVCPDGPPPFLLGHSLGGAIAVTYALRHGDSLAGLVLPGQVSELRTPLLLLHGSEDQLCPPEGSQMVYDGAQTSDRTLKVYPGLYHEVFNEPERDQVM